MSNGEIIKTGQEDLNRLDRFRPSKHKKAYKIQKNFKKRCYLR